ncbi:MAG: group 1 truncated hemoglobin [Gemmatimonadetes bacterium]|nr:group 1 truncated hemoglobin [Gemmatimonadota bacterium]
MSSLSLFEKYGGFGSLYPLVGAFYDAVLESEIVSYMFDSVDMAELIEHQTKFIAVVMGGPGKYDDQSLKAAHSELDINDAEWDEIVRILIETLRNFHIEENDIATLVDLIAAKKPVIVAGR